MVVWVVTVYERSSPISAAIKRPPWQASNDSDKQSNFSLVLKNSYQNNGWLIDYSRSRMICEILYCIIVLYTVLLRFLLACRQDFCSLPRARLPR